MTEKRFRELLERAAQTIIEDIRGDMGEILGPGADYGYECYTDSIPPHYQGDFGADQIGVVYAGDLGVWFFVPAHPDAHEGEQVDLVFVERALAPKLMPRIFGAGGIYAYESQLI